MISIDAGGWLAAQMRLWRERALLTQEQLADSSGLGVRTIRRLESRVDLRPRSESIRLLAAALRLTDEELAQLVSAGDGRARKRPATGVIEVPRQLPRDVVGFTGRTGELSHLDGLEPGGVVVISGMAGVGKTALAVHWAHRAAGQAANGQLYVNLRGFDPGGPPVPPATAVRGFLSALGVPHRHLPPGAQIALYRSTMACRRMLLVLDNAANAQQVRPLLPGAGASTVVVTSRQVLAGLAATEGAHLLRLDLLRAGQARRLLARRIGAARAGVEPQAIREIAELCAGLPIALAIAAAVAASEPGLSLAALAHRLRDSGQRLSALDLADAATDLRAVFAWSYHQLSGPAARLFRLLSLHPGAEVRLAAAARLAALPPGTAADLLAELVAANLIGEPRKGSYAMHDLLRLFAREQLAPGEAAETLQRLGA